MSATAILDLERAGFSREQVEALARWQEGGLDVSHLATKADLAASAAATKADFAEVRREIAEARTDFELKVAEVRSDLRVLEHRMTIKLGGMIGAAVLLIGAFLRLFPGGHP